MYLPNLYRGAVVAFICQFLLACDNVYTLSKTIEQPLTFAQFEQMQGYPLDYDLYLPSPINFWSHVDNFKFIYEEQTQIYWLKNIVLNKHVRDNNALDFKISNVDWHHQFGFGHMRINPDESIFSVPEQGQIIFQLIYSNNASNLTLELPHNTDANYVSFAIKVLDSSIKPKALLFAQLSNKPIP
ncbi:hypothetical protein ACMZOO_02650 [Catenovulum sp. SX2]|uniref:hypothetical protein n=1 Tax=Catenovulum sp. SX2 TaxID=3398614 RepID=UPI003F852052